jgi:hypothetical protein
MTNSKHKSFRFKLWAGLIALAAICIPVLFAFAQTTATLYTDGTNFGIGTTGPTQKLQVVGTVSATAFSGDGSALTGVGGGASGWTDGGTNVYTSTTTDLVGIGTTTPSTTLEIVKQGTSAPLMVSATATGDGNYLIVTSTGNIGIGTVSPSYHLSLTGTGADQTIGLEREATAATNGRDLVLRH